MNSNCFSRRISHRPSWIRYGVICTDTTISTATMPQVSKSKPIDFTNPSTGGCCRKRSGGRQRAPGGEGQSDKAACSPCWRMRRNEANITTMRIAWNPAKGRAVCCTQLESSPGCTNPGRPAMTRPSSEAVSIGLSVTTPGVAVRLVFGVEKHPLDLTPDSAECHSDQQILLEEKDHRNRWQYVDERDGGNE